MTPEEAQALNPGTTDGAWEAYTVPGDRTTGDYVAVSLGDREMVVPPRNGGMGTALDAHLIAAAPDMLATIAAQTWQYGAQCDSCKRLIWRVRREDAEGLAVSMSRMHPECSYRLVGRPVGPAEVIDG